MRYTLLKVDIHGLNGNVRFHADYNFSDCVYTKDNIPPSVINPEGKMIFKAKIK